MIKSVNEIPSILTCKYYIRGGFLKLLDSSLDFRILSAHILIDIVLSMHLSARNLRYESPL